MVVACPVWQDSTRRALQWSGHSGKEVSGDLVLDEQFREVLREVGSPCSGSRGGAREAEEHWQPLWQWQRLQWRGGSDGQ